ncbi:hypothetical protein D3C85_1200470 [compost metagenome]
MQRIDQIAVQGLADIALEQGFLGLEVAFVEHLRHGGADHGRRAQDAALGFHVGQGGRQELVGFPQQARGRVVGLGQLLGLHHDFGGDVEALLEQQRQHQGDGDEDQEHPPDHLAIGEQGAEDVVQVVLALDGVHG